MDPGIMVALCLYRGGRKGDGRGHHVSVVPIYRREKEKDGPGHDGSLVPIQRREKGRWTRVLCLRGLNTE